MATLELKPFICGKPYTISLFRCRDCNALLSLQMIKDGACAGHYIFESVYLTLWEKIKIMLGLVK